MVDVDTLKRSLEQIKESSRLADALTRINWAINSTLDFNEIMQRVVVEATEAINADSVTINIPERDYWLIKYTYGLPGGEIGKRLPDKATQPIVVAAKTRKPVAISDTYRDERVNIEYMKALGIHSLLAIPLMAREENIGVLSFQYHEPVSFTESYVDFASKLGASISLALENARLFEYERNIADVLQEALLIVPEKIDGLDFGYLYEAASDAARVGGDFYDIFELEHGKVGITIGDVAGKGLDAATLTSLVRNTLRAYAYEGISPAKVMEKANNAVKKASPLGSFITVVFCILDINTGHITYCSAGHPQSILKIKTGETSYLDMGSPIIGAFANLRYTDNELDIEKGDILVFYTDGVTEARCYDGFFGEDRLLEVVRDLKPMGADEMPRAIFDMVKDCAGSKLSDDTVLLTISLREK